MLGLFKKKKSEPEKEVIYAPISGEAVESKEINDPTFAEEMLGKGMAIRPLEGKVYAPADGTVTMIFETKHAISITTKEGAELLIHIGLDTVSLKGKYFTAHVAENASVKKGDLLLAFDKEAIEAAGYDTISPVIVCNTDAYQSIRRIAAETVKAGDPILELKR